MGAKKSKKVNKRKPKKVETKTGKKNRQEVQEKREQDKYIYVYGITNSGEINLNIKGLKNNPITKIAFKDISVLVSFYPSLHPMVEENEAILHAEILNKFATKTTIIPMAFGTVFKDHEILENILVKSYQTIKATLKLIGDKVELGLKVVKNREDEYVNGLAEEISESLNSLSVKSIQGDKFSDRLLLNNSFLVEKNKFSEFSDKISELETKHRDLKFLYTGPWPPYSFVNIKIAGS